MSTFLSLTRALSFFVALCVSSAVTATATYGHSGGDRKQVVVSWGVGESGISDADFGGWNALGSVKLSN